MKMMEKPVGRRSEKKTDISNEGYPTEDGIGRRKQFSFGCFDGDDRPHSTQDHGCIVQGIDPGNFFSETVTQYADKKT
jgi:hypothetical protein